MMSKRGKTAASRRPLGNQRRTRVSFAEAMSGANRRAHEQANRRSGRRELKSVHAAIASSVLEEEYESLDWGRQIKRILLALLMLPICWVTTWTFLDRFDASLAHGFWQTHEFWYFAVGVLVMVGWFMGRLARTFLLYLYVLGHELTHALCVWCFLGKVTGFSASAEGGYITTTKTNIVIALSPYFVPFWSLVAALVFVACKHFLGLTHGWDLVFYLVLGVTWTFHMVWTVWMLPRDQPDLKEHGTFFSLVLIYLVNLLLLVALLCMASKSPWHDAKAFVMDWVKLATTCMSTLWRWLVVTYGEWRAAGKF